MPAEFNAAQIAFRVRRLGISDAQFAALIVASPASVCRWFKGESCPERQQTMLMFAIRDLEELFRQLAPIRPDLSDPVNARAVMTLFSENHLWIGVRSVGYEEAYNLTRDEVEKAKKHFEAGLKALAVQVLSTAQEN